MSMFRKVRSRIEREVALAAGRRFRRDRPVDSECGGQLFILGLPRSGTTLVYQYIVHRLHVAYFTNGVGARPYDPCRTTWLQIRSGETYRSDFKSEYGRSRGDLAPREAGNFWLRFFDIDAFQVPGDVPEAALAEMRREVACVQSLFAAPFVNKNVKHLLRIPILCGAFPDPHFLLIERDRVDVALSLLRARLDSTGSYDAWFSARPPDYAALERLDPVEQVAGQVAGLERRMREDIARVEPARVHRVDYEAFCRTPDSVLTACSAVLGGVREKNAAVASFEMRRAVPRNDTEERLAALVRGNGGT